VTLYIKHVKAYLSQLPTSSNAPAGRGRGGRAPLRLARPGPRAGRTVPSTSVTLTPKLAVIDTEV